MKQVCCFDSFGMQKSLSNSRLMASVYSSGICSRYSFSPSASLVLYSLCFHYNVSRQDMYPTQVYISKKTGLSLSSVKRAIKELLAKGIILKTRNKYGNYYKFTQKFFDEINSSCQKYQNNSSESVILNSSKNEHENKNNNNKYKKRKNATYSRNLNSKHITKLFLKEESTINQMVKFQFWKHKPSNKILKIKPDIGEHLLIKYDSSQNTVTFYEENLTDTLNNFEIIRVNPQIPDLSNKTKPSKKDLINYCLTNNLTQEAKQLAKIFKQ